MRFPWHTLLQSPATLAFTQHGQSYSSATINEVAGVEISGFNNPVRDLPLPWPWRIPVEFDPIPADSIDSKPERQINLAQSLCLIAHLDG